MIKALDALWTYTGEIFIATSYELQAASESVGIDPSLLKQAWMKKITDVFEEATLSIPENKFMQTGGKEGKHTEHLGYILAELQYMQRAYPDSTW
jgi:ring-1,2-phenylacetyl-CoA epoxidase subunit PaaC